MFKFGGKGGEGEDENEGDDGVEREVGGLGGLEEEEEEQDEEQVENVGEEVEGAGDGFEELSQWRRCQNSSSDRINRNYFERDEKT